MARTDGLSGDAGRFVVVAAGAEPPLEPDGGDLVVPTDAVEEVDEFVRVSEPGSGRRTAWRPPTPQTGSHFYGRGRLNVARSASMHASSQPFRPSPFRISSILPLPSRPRCLSSPISPIGD
jgi:hypothetical protein